jgi:hypothetical protein
MKIDANGIQDFIEKPQAPQVNKANAPSRNAPDASLQVNSASIIEQAGQIPQVDVEAVQRARQMLLSGQLESPQNIQAAAENIARFGI